MSTKLPHTNQVECAIGVAALDEAIDSSRQLHGDPRLMGVAKLSRDPNGGDRAKGNSGAPYGDIGDPLGLGDVERRLDECTEKVKALLREFGRCATAGHHIGSTGTIE